MYTRILESHQLAGSGSQVVEVPGLSGHMSSARKGAIPLPLYHNHYFAKSGSKEVDGVYECMGLSPALDQHPFEVPG